ncbi:TetR/AcrR family transcriptional regulator [Sciscionella marina]|uniref:TetR/AcrR family transcriptional regulator n=1 Tax=Sciscionella marina TaxID=508770 RepID=UPI0003632F2A|nr:TetR/AcrR family transcriptional regulator [Sciscionella marina]
MPRRSQVDRSRETKTALIATARELFGAHGYTQVSAEELVTATGLSRGALHHHFGDKRGLFLAVLEQIEQEITAEVAEAIQGHPELWQGMVAALRCYLDSCQRPEVIQITLTDAPAVLGWKAWRELETEHGLGLITEALRGAAAAGILRPAPIPALAQLLLSAIIEVSLIIANAEDPEQARADAEQSLLLLVSGLLQS